METAGAVLAGAALLWRARVRRWPSSSGSGGGTGGSSACSPRAGKTVIGVDLDEVLGGFVQALAGFHNERYGSSLQEKDFHSYTFCEVWGGSNSEAIVKVFEFFETPWFKERLRPVPGAVDSLRRLVARGDCELVVVTSRQHEIGPQTLLWLEEHFGGLFSQVLFGNHWSRDKPHPELECVTKRSKSDLCLEAGAKLLIDDNKGYCQQVGAIGVQAVLFGEYGWNSETAEERAARGQHVTRCRDWREAEAAVHAFLDAQEAAAI